MAVAVARTARGVTRLQSLLLGLLGLGTVAVLAVVVVLAMQLQDARAEDQRREDILQAARQQGVNITTLDYRSVDKDLSRVLAQSTGTFRKEFESGTKDLTDLVVKNKAVSTGEVLAAGIVTADSDSARVLVVADATVGNSASSDQQQVRHYRMQLDMVRSGNRWLTSTLTFVG
jgi:Mce-associated membrane protein